MRLCIYNLELQEYNRLINLVFREFGGTMISSRVKKIMSEKKIKQKQLSALTGINVKRLNRVLNAKSTLSADEFVLLCSALDVNMSDVLNLKIH